MIVSGSRFQVRQTGAAGTYSLVSTNASHPSGVSLGSVGINTSAACPWSAGSDVDWIRFPFGTNGAGTGSLTYELEPNLTVGQRTGHILIAGLAFTVTQAAPALVLRPCTGTVIHGGNLVLAETDTLVVELCGEAISPDFPLLQIGGVFRAGGELRIIIGPGDEPQAGDRFRIAQFPVADTETAEDIYRNYVFKNYDPTIAGHPELFWGLAFRSAGGVNFLELLVLKAPTLWGNGSGSPYPDHATGKPGLVFVTHGTSASVGGPTDGSWGEMSATISRFLTTYGNGDWEVVSFDWREYATAFFPTEAEVFFNPATSAQIAIGLGESVLHWLQSRGVNYHKMHLMSHSSGSWFVNRMMQVEGTNAAVHVTFFDAFTRPGQSSPQCIFPYCDRFQSELGAGSDSGDFVEHYVDRNIASPLGTGDRISRAINFDVTGAVVPQGDFNSPPYTTPQEPYFLPPPLNFAYMVDAHGWPYKWYFQSGPIRFSRPHAISERWVLWVHALAGISGV